MNVVLFSWFSVCKVQVKLTVLHMASAYLARDYNLLPQYNWHTCIVESHTIKSKCIAWNVDVSVALL